MKPRPITMNWRGALAAVEMGFIEADAKVLGKAWSRMTTHMMAALTPLNGLAA